ncbi:hypothetical protein OG203_06490 [Nocardia sp. NBC_01499]|uniref:alpha/beta hydrolase family protein n=1 Tax=Nocardia sp. NBC_01499 TaxID=2903597 RepID=UPI00386E683B
MIQKRAVASLSAVAVLLTAGACSEEGGRTPPAANTSSISSTERGTVLNTVPLTEMNPDQVRAYLRDQGVDASKVRFGVIMLRIEYASIDPAGQPTKASALVARPKTDSARPQLVSWQHGTTVSRASTASMTADSSNRATAVLFAADGYLVSAPDYLGLGTGPGLHPYDDLPSTVTASVDALRATRTLGEQAGHRIDGRVLLSGHSQGGPAAMAVGRELSRGGVPGLRPAALAPISGPHDFSGSLRTAVTGPQGGINHASAYLAYLTVAWQRLHHLYNTPSEAFRSPYDQTVERSLDGSQPANQVLATLPVNLDELFTPEFLARLRNPSGTLAAAIQVADSSCQWRPPVPVTLFASRGDRDVPIANATHCEDAIRAEGGQATMTDLGDIDHGATALQALPQVLTEFNQAIS